MDWESGQGDLQVQVIPAPGLVGALESRCTTQAKKAEEANMEAEAPVPLLVGCPDLLVVVMLLLPSGSWWKHPVVPGFSSGFFLLCVVI